MIPHIIHYGWFGHASKPRLIQKCIASWKKYHPDWEIIEWNETNYNINKIPYTRDAYARKKWAFVVDYARFDILNEYGGVFLDTDVELLRPIPDKMLEHEAFTGFENEGSVAPGLIYASIPGQRMLQNIITMYQEKAFSTEETIVNIVSSILKEHGMVDNNTRQTIDGVVVYPKEYFCCFDQEARMFETTKETISIHHYLASWVPWHRKLRFKCIKCAARILGKERYLKWKRKIKRKDNAGSKE